MNRTAVIAALGLLVATAACNRAKPAPEPSASSPAATLGIVPAFMDTSVKPRRSASSRRSWIRR